MADPLRARAIFLEAVENHAPANWPAFLEQACGTDVELRQRVEVLLRAHEQANSMLDNAPATPSDTVDQRHTDGPGTVIGPYKLLEELGEGGMGTVWMAQQQEPVKRLVAVKLIKSGLDSRQVIARFEAERQALALMDHPNIAKVLDAGTVGGARDEWRGTSEAEPASSALRPSPLAPAFGRPYFVMELVKGVPITKYCDEHRLTPRQRLDLFVPVCQAVQHAHQKGIIHRDLKPSNVLVALYDGKPVPKVIDFGVAKATGQQLTDKTLVTGFGSIVGTLEYMSPEQAEHNQLDIDTRSDIYSLGVVLYELLTGSTPLDRKRLKQAAFVEMLRIIREEEPPKPSTRLSELGSGTARRTESIPFGGEAERNEFRSTTSLASISAVRSTEPAKLAKLVRGELDWIVMKALEKDRSRRYETANGLAMDLQRYLADEPVLACPPSARYRLRKFVRRNKAAVVVGTVATIGLLATLIALSIGLAGVNRERKETARERDEKVLALDAETKARERTMAALRDLTDDIVENQMARGAELTEENKEFLRKIIKHFESFAAITGDDAESRAIQAEGYYRVARMRHRLGEHKEAEVAFDRASVTFNQLAGEFPTNPEHLRYLAKCKYELGILLADKGQTKEAEAAFHAARDLRGQLAAQFPARSDFRQELANSYGALAVFLTKCGRLDEAASEYRQATDMQEQLTRDFPERTQIRRDLALTRNNWGELYLTTGQFEEAEASWTQAVAMYKQLPLEFSVRPDVRMELAMCYGNLGHLHARIGRMKDAEARCTDALTIAKQLAADFPTRPQFRDLAGWSHNQLGLLFHNTRRPKDAEMAYVQAVAIRKQLASDFPARLDFRHGLAQSQVNLANLFKLTGRPKNAESAYNDSVAILLKLTTEFPRRSEFRQDLAKGYDNLGVLFREAGDLARSEEAHKQALAIRTKLNDEFPNRLDFLDELAGGESNLGLLLRDIGRAKESEASFRSALSKQKRLLVGTPNQPDMTNRLAGTLQNLAILLNQRRDFVSARTYLEEAEAHHHTVLKANSNHSTYQTFYQGTLVTLVATFAGLLDQANALRTAERLRDLGWDPAICAYNAGCALALCIPIVEKDTTLDAAKRQAAVQFYGDQAMKMLRDAVGKGYKDAEHMKKDTDLDPLRQREDFKKLLAELEAGKKPAEKKPLEKKE